MTVKYAANISYPNKDSVDGVDQDFVKALFADPDINSTQKLGAVNS